MSKVSEYLNEHLLGEVVITKAVREKFSRDGSVLSITPEMVIYPRATSDIRKVARFAWQLAEKGHPLGITVRGGGTDGTGAAIGKGIIIATKAHLNTIVHLGVKDRYVHLQPGANLREVNNVLRWNGLFLPGAPLADDHGTVGGILANNEAPAAGTRKLADSISRLEVVLSNGDLIETTRVSRKDVSKRQGLQTFEGDIYRKIDALIEDNQQLINEKLSDPDGDHTGYANIGMVRGKDGSIDLTPLIIGSQGTLGIISEIVLNTSFYSPNQATLIAIASSNEGARDLADDLKQFDPAALETLDGGLFEQAQDKGKIYAFFDDDAQETTVGAVVYLKLIDFSERALNHKLARVTKFLEKAHVPYLTSTTRTPEDIEAIRDVFSALLNPDSDRESMPPLIDGAIIPRDRHEDFSKELAELADKHHIKLPLKTNVLSGAVYARPVLRLDQLADKQKVFRLINDYAVLVDKCRGTFLGASPEGRVKAPTAWHLLDEDVRELYQKVKEIFDPFGILNPGVKQPGDLKALIGSLRETYSTADFADFAPKL